MSNIIDQTRTGATIGACTGIVVVKAAFVLAVAGTIYNTATDKCRHEGCGNVWPLFTLSLLVFGARFSNEALAAGFLVGGAVGGAVGFSTGCARKMHSFFEGNRHAETLNPPQRLDDMPQFLPNT